MPKQEKELTPEQTELNTRHTEIVNKINDFIKDNKDLDFGTNTTKVVSFGSLVKEYERQRSKNSTVSKNQREWHRENKTLESFKKYRIRVSESSVYQLTEFYNFLLSFKGDVVAPSKKIPKERHPLGSETLVDFLRKKSAKIIIPDD